MSETPGTFSFNDQEIAILNNFQAINPSIIVKSDKLGTITESNTVFGFYTFETDRKFKPFGIYLLSQFITLVKEMQEHAIEIQNTDVIIYDQLNNSKVSYRTTPIDGGILKEAKYPSKVAETPSVLEMTLQSDTAAQLKKIGDVVGFQCVYIEPFQDVVKFVGANVDRANTENTFEVIINKSDITKNTLDEPLVIKRHEFNMILAGYDYGLTIVKSDKGNYISQWNNKTIPALEYFVGIGKEG